LANKLGSTPSSTKHASLPAPLTPRTTPLRSSISTSTVSTVTSSNSNSSIGGVSSSVGNDTKTTNDDNGNGREHNRRASRASISGHDIIFQSHTPTTPPLPSSTLTNAHINGIGNGQSDDDNDGSDTVRRSSTLLSSPRTVNASLVDVETAWNGVMAAQRELERQMQLLLHATVHVHADASMGALMPSSVLDSPLPSSWSTPHLQTAPSTVTVTGRSPLDDSSHELSSDTAAYLSRLSAVKNRTAQMLSVLRNEYRPLRAAMHSLRSSTPSYPASSTSNAMPVSPLNDDPTISSSSPPPLISTSSINSNGSSGGVSGVNGVASSITPRVSTVDSSASLTPLTINVHNDAASTAALAASIGSPSMTGSPGGIVQIAGSVLLPTRGDGISSNRLSIITNDDDAQSQSSRVRQASLQRLISTSVKSPPRQRPRSIVMFTLRGKRHVMSSSTTDDEPLSGGPRGDAAVVGSPNSSTPAGVRSRALSNVSNRRTTELPPTLSFTVDAARRAASAPVAAPTSNPLTSTTRQSTITTPLASTSVVESKDMLSSLHGDSGGMITSMRATNLAIRLKWVQAIRTICALVREVKTNGNATRTPIAVVAEAQRKAAMVTTATRQSLVTPTPMMPAIIASGATSGVTRKVSDPPLTSNGSNSTSPPPPSPSVSHRFIDYFVAFSVVTRGSVSLPAGGPLVEDPVGLADTGEDEALTSNSEIMVIRRCHPHHEQSDFPLPHLALFCLGTRPRTRTPATPSAVAAATAAASAVAAVKRKVGGGKSNGGTPLSSKGGSTGGNGGQRRHSLTSAVSEAPVFFNTVLTDMQGNRVYASCVHYYQPITPAGQVCITHAIVHMHTCMHASLCAV
jgi:hypothetical protein